MTVLYLIGIIMQNINCVTFISEKSILLGYEVIIFLPSYLNIYTNKSHLASR